VTDRRPTVAIIGLGLIGGSLARDLSALGWRVVAADRDPTALNDAIAAKIVDERFDAGFAAEDAAGDAARDAASGMLGLAEVIVIATPLAFTGDLVRWLADAGPRAAVVTDVGSTKRTIMAAARQAGLSGRFVGGHPMAGDHRSGWGAARSGLFAGAPVWLCREAADAAAVERVARLWTAVGGIPREIDAAAHDRLVAWSSHLPQVLGSALGAVLGRAGVGASELGPGGRDATRLAGSDPVLWSGILLDNADVLEPALDALVGEVIRLRGHLRARDAEGVGALLAEARTWARRWEG
jgi:prephenate dehydrogenase